MTTLDAGTLRAIVLLAGLTMNDAARAGDQPKPAPAAVPTGASANGIGTEAKVWRILCAPATQLDASRAAATDRIVKLGPEALPVVLHILTGSIAEPELPADFVVHPDLVEHRQAILQDSLRAFPRATVLPAIRGLVTPESEIDLRLLAVQLIGTVGGAEAFDTVIDLASGLDPIHFERAYVQNAIEGALTNVLINDATTYKRLPQSVARASRALLPLVVNSIGSAGSAAGLPVLSGLFGRDEALDLLLVDVLGQVSESSYTELPAGEIARLGRFLEHSDPEIVRASAKTLGRAGNEDYCPQLIALLEHSDKRVVGAALWSLKQLSRQDIGANSAAWTRWHQGQMQWHDAEFEALVQRLRSENPGEVVHALGKLVVHPLFKHEAARELCLTLDANQPALARTTCSTLAQLGSTHAVPALVALLDAADDALRIQAAESLRILTGRNLPPERAQWSKALRL